MGEVMIGLLACLKDRLIDLNVSTAFTTSSHPPDIKSEKGVSDRRRRESRRERRMVITGSIEFEESSAPNMQQHHDNKSKCRLSLQRVTWRLDCDCINQ